jgi:hypothetical protein
MNNLKTVSTLVFIIVSAANVMAFDLPTTAAVEVVEGISIAQTTQMNFGSVADHDGTITVTTDEAVAMTDPNFLSFDPTGYTPGIFTCTSIAGASVNASFVDDDDIAGLNLSAFTVSVNGGADEALLTAITQLTAADTWNVGATLTVVALDAIVGVHAPGYTITVVLN